jgi:hypothetical protein
LAWDEDDAILVLLLLLFIIPALLAVLTAGEVLDEVADIWLFEP